MSTSARTARRKQQQANKAQPKLWIWAALVLAGVGLIIAAIAANSGSSGNAPNFTANTLSGETVTLSDYQGKVVMLNFWATWCPPCRAEMPSIQAAFEQYEDEGFVVLAVNNAESAAQIIPFANNLALSFPILLDTNAQLQRVFGIQGYPTSVFINAEGNIYATHSGMVTPGQLAGYIESGLTGTG